MNKPAYHREVKRAVHVLSRDLAAGMHHIGGDLGVVEDKVQRLEKTLNEVTERMAPTVGQRHGEGTRLDSIATDAKLLAQEKREAREAREEKIKQLREKQVQLKSDRRPGI